MLSKLSVHRTASFPTSVLSRGALLLLAIHLFSCLLVRLILMAMARHDLTPDRSLAWSFANGLWFDVLAGIYVLGVWWLLAPLLFARWWGMAVGKWFLLLMITLHVSVLAFIDVAEILFWQEFQCRFNFIAVDYLIFTQEVVRNIRESYPMPLIFGAIALIGAGFTWGLLKIGAVRWVLKGKARQRDRLILPLAHLALLVLVSNVFSQRQLAAFANEHHRELAKSGIYAFGAAFWESEIDYERFYRNLPQEEAFSKAKQLLALPSTPLVTDAATDLRRTISGRGSEKQYNVIFFSVESLSASFLEHFGNKQGLTPNLDELCEQGIWFNQMYATGTRTVRGLEALTLSLPPTPGQSIVWRPGNAKMFTLGSVFRSRGYETSYVYGGDAMFDNMNAFFSANGYRVVDRQRKSAKDVTFQNAWGACDEDLMRWVLEEGDNYHAASKPFFLHAMTTSNHRPFTYPEGKIDIPSHTGRIGGVKYTDYAFGRFIAEFKKRPWAENTLVVIVADHCDGSAGKVELDVQKYRIPFLIWNPLLVQPKKVDALCSQIDVAPTLLGFMGWGYTSRFYGQDVLNPDYTRERERCFISNYQRIAYFSAGRLAILKPKGEYVLTDVNLEEGTFQKGNPEALTHHLGETVSYYQTAAWLFRNRRLSEDVSAP